MPITTDSATLLNKSKITNKAALSALNEHPDTKYPYTYYNNFHPFVSELIGQLNKKSIDGLFDLDFQEKLSSLLKKGPYLELDFNPSCPYANYNWELFFHVPLIIAVHLSKNQRFEEARKWFHYIFDPTTTEGDESDPKRFWKFSYFRKDNKTNITEILKLLSTPDSEITDPKELSEKETFVNSYKDLLENPFQPHVVARARPSAYAYSVVMKYIDNLVAWGDSLFRQDTIETINEATQLYVLAANILGDRPQQIPTLKKAEPKTFADLRNSVDALGNAAVEVESNISINANFETNTEKGYANFWANRTLYFCVPSNTKLLSYWDQVADRLFKIRHCMNMEGIVRQLPLFEPRIDPGMLVKAAAAGLDPSSMMNGLYQPVSHLRSTFLIQKAIELCNEVKGMGSALLSHLEKEDNESLTLLRQKHEINIQKHTQDIRFLQWKEAEESIESLIKTRENTLGRYCHYQRLMGKKESDLAELWNLNIQSHSVTEDTFDEIYSKLVEQYATPLKLTDYPKLSLMDGSPYYLNWGENEDLNVRAPDALSSRIYSSDANMLGTGLALIPDVVLQAAPMGVGQQTRIAIGTGLSEIQRFISESFSQNALINDARGASASKTASFQRRVEDWIFQSNSAARELMQIGRQIISALIREQITRHEYETQKKQIEQSIEVDEFLHSKYTNKELYTWLRGETSKLYYQYYKFAFDVAKKAELTMKYELMRPELDQIDFVKFNWDEGRKGLLSGENLLLDLKRMEMAYHDYNKREYELTKNISVRQLDPNALLKLQAEGECTLDLPEWLFDLDCPGHYMRRIKNVSITIPSVTGPYTNVSCTLSLLNSKVRKSPLLQGDQYKRTGDNDDRFVQYTGTIQSVVTSNAQNDGGLFETNLHEERFLPFEGAGVESSWNLSLPKDYRQFDYTSISDVILQIRYTAREAGGKLKDEAIKSFKEYVKTASTTTGTNGDTPSVLTRILNLTSDFPSEWYNFLSTPTATECKMEITTNYFPYFAQNINGVVIDKIHYLKKNVLSPSINNSSNSITKDKSIWSLKINRSSIKEAFDYWEKENIPNTNRALFVILRYSLT